MKIKVVGAGCANCKKLYEVTKKTVEELGVNAQVEYITDINEMLSMGIISTPALVIDDKLISSGYVPPSEKIKELILENFR